MFGMLALGIFSVFAFSGIFGNGGKSGSSSEGGFGSKILGFLGVKSLSDIFSGSVSTSSSSSKDDNDDDNEDKKSDSDVDFNKSLALIQQQMDSEKDEDKKKQLVEDYNEMLSCVYDENGNKLSQNQIQKNLESKPEFKKKLEKQALIAAKDEKIAKQFKENSGKIDDIQAIKAGEKAVIAHLEVVKNKKLEETKDDEEEKKRIEAEYDALISTHKSNIESIEKTAKEIEELNKEKTALNAEDAVKKEIEKCSKINWDGEPYSKGDLTGDDEEKKKGAEEFLKSKGVDSEIYRKYEAVKGSINDGEKIEDNEDLKKAAEEAVKKKKEEIDKQISDKNKEIKNTVKSQEHKKKEEPEKKEENEEVELLNDDGEKTGEKIIKKSDGSYVKVDKDGKESAATEDDFKDAKSEYEEGDGDEENSQEDNDADKDLDTNYEENDDEKNSDEGKKAERDSSGKRVNPAKVWHKRKKKDGKGSTKSYYNSKGDSISAKDFREKMENYKSYVQKHKKTKQEESFNISNFLRDKLIVERFYPSDISKYLKEHLR